MIHPQISRDQALAALETFLPKAGSRYARERNEDRGPGAHTAVSQLSPFLRHRLLTEQEVASAAHGAHGRGAEKFVQEVFWRTYFKGYLEHKPALWAHYRSALEEDLQRYGADEMAQATLQAALQGETGIEPFDAWLTELKETGYLHNHARMWFASIWIFTLRLPWTIGADLFMQHLLDGDPASNTLSWRWVAGLHTRGKHYLARAENIARYTGDRFGPVGGLNENADPIEEAPPPSDMAVPHQPLTTLDEPCTALDPSADGLLLHEEDLHPESFADPLTSLPAAVLLFAFLANGSAFLAFAATAERLGLSTQAQGAKSLYYVAGLAEGAETILVFALFCLLPDWFGPLAYGFAALCLLSAGARIALAARTFRGA